MSKTLLVRQAAEYYGVSRRTIYNYLKSGKLQYIVTKNGSRRVIIDDETILRRSKTSRK